ncbi:MAG: class I SAM-dependent methyltransferase [Isosphaeraceae bacterium]
MDRIAMIVRWIEQATRFRHCHPSLLDSLKVPLLQLGTTRFGGGFSRGKVVPIRLRSLREPLALRWGSFDIYAMIEIFYWGEYALPPLWTTSTQPTIIDLGGNIGLATLYFDTLWPEARYLIAEPDPGNLSMLERNCAAIIKQGRADVVAAFVADEDGRARIDRSNGSLGYRMAGDDSSVDEQAEIIPRIGIRTLLARVPSQAIYLTRLSDSIQRLRACLAAS